MPCARSATCSAVVPLLVAIAWRTPIYSANARSNSATRAPCASIPDSSTRATARFSSSPIQGLEIGIIGILDFGLRRLLQLAVRVHAIPRAVVFANPNAVAVFAARLEAPSTFAHIADAPRGNAHDQRVRGHIFGDDRTGGNHRPRADAQIGQDN